MAHNDDFDNVEDAIIEESSPAPVLAILSNLNPSNLEERVRNAAKEMAKQIFESKAENIDNLNQIVVATASSIAGNKTEGMVFLYIITQEIAALDKSGEIASLFLQKGIIKKIYNLFGNSIDDAYRDGTATLQIFNSKAYLIDAFITDFFPLYANGEIITMQGMTGELIYPDKFLNIFFRAVKKCYENDKVMGDEVLRHQAMLTTNNAGEEQQRVSNIIERIFERETNRVLSLFRQSDKIRIQTFLEGKIDELLRLSNEHKKDAGSGNQQDAVVEALNKLTERVNQLSGTGNPESLPNGFDETIKKIDRNVISVLENQILLRKRIDEIKEPEDDFLSDIQPQKRPTGMTHEIGSFDKEEVLGEIRSLSLTVEKMLEAYGGKHPHDTSTSLELPADDPMMLFGAMSEAAQPESVPQEQSSSYSFDPDVISKLFKTIVEDAVAPIKEGLQVIQKQVVELEEKVISISDVSGNIHGMLKSEIESTEALVSQLNK
ncbi:MAG: hypothetical protein PHT07_10600 [Paludibacter sp.]|nr:hypothetical protein [Paludibacter sp.]